MKHVSTVQIHDTSLMNGMLHIETQWLGISYLGPAYFLDKSHIYKWMKNSIRIVACSKHVFISSVCVVYSLVSDDRGHSCGLWLFLEHK